jgi:hypothetical protein
MVDILGKKVYNYFIMTNDKINKLINDSNILNLYYYGSTVYKSNNTQSDIDLIAVVNNKSIGQIIDDNINISFYTKEEFKVKLEEHDISALECLFLSNDFILKKTIDFDVVINNYKLRCACSEKASNSFVKAKKKIQEGNIYIGQKSLFHSIRIIDFAIQIITHGRIINYESVSSILFEILKLEPNSVVSIFKPIYNGKKSELRKLESGH